MQNLTDHINTIENKVRLVLQKIEELKAENNVLKEANKSLRERFDGQISNQETKLVVSPPVQGIKVDVEGIKKELDQYIDEIDQTIELLKAS